MKQSKVVALRIGIRLAAVVMGDGGQWWAMGGVANNQPLTPEVYLLAQTASHPTHG